jgi:hypothetical protein
VNRQRIQVLQLSDWLIRRYIMSVCVCVTNDFSKDLTAYSGTRYEGYVIKYRSDAIIFKDKKRIMFIFSLLHLF